MYTGPDDPGYMSNIPPWRVFAAHLRKIGLGNEADLIFKHLARVGA
jgi:hypothetical protein